MTLPRRVAARFAADLSQLVAIRRFLRTHAAAAGFDVPTLDDLELAVDEGCANVMRYAYPPDHVAPMIELAVELDENSCTVVIADEGVAFDLETVPPVDLLEHRVRRHTHGLGIHLMRTLMDRVEARRLEHGNELRLVKHRP